MKLILTKEEFRELLGETNNENIPMILPSQEGWFLNIPSFSKGFLWWKKVELLRIPIEVCEDTKCE